MVALLAVVVVALVIGGRSDGSDPSPAARARRVAASLRCPVCQGLSVADSPSETARAMVEDVRRRVDQGESDAEIRQAFVDRYGETILLSPPGSGVSALVWALPGIFLVLAGGGLALAFWRWRREPGLTLDPEDRGLVDRALVDRELARRQGPE